MAAEIPKSVLAFRSRTRRLYLWWWGTHYGVGFLGVLAGAVLTATSANKSIAPEGSWAIGIVAAVCTSLVTFLGPLHKAERYWSAFHMLDHACLEYELGLISIKAFVDRVRAARKHLQAFDSETRPSLDGSSGARASKPRSAAPKAAAPLKAV